MPAMPPTGYLGALDLEEIIKAALSSGLILRDRQLLLAQLPIGFVAGLPLSADPLSQFALDLAGVNRVERLEDGIVPLVQYLRNGSGRLRLEGKTEAAVFEKYANRIENLTSGLAGLPSPATLPEIVKQEAIVHQDDTVSIEFLSAALAVGRSVGRIAVPRFEGGKQRILPGDKPWLGNGSGWMIGDGLFITNHHVVNAREVGEARAQAADFDLQGQGSTIWFDYDSETSAKSQATITSVVAADPSLDYTILRVNTGAARRPLTLNANDVVVLPSTYLPVNIIQHPRGHPKRIAFRNNLVSGVDGPSLRYFTDTDYGSSGSPVCDDSWRVVALHRGAVQAAGVSFQGKDTTYVNFGTVVSKLLEDLKARANPVHEEILAAQANI
jgi:V8-like Glu-specific endopeptidase